MKKDLHPTYFPEAKITCVCGNSFVAGGTLDGLQVEICSACHPFYTGKQKLIDTSRRVEKFQARSAQQATLGAVRKGKKGQRAKAANRKAKAEEK